MIETERLIIRRFTPLDAKHVYDCCNDYDVVKTTLKMPWPYTMEIAEGWINKQIQNENDGENYELAICFKNDPKKVIGCIALLNIKSEPKRAELGYWVGKKYWRQGIATEAARAMIEYGFNKLGLHSIIARYFDINPASGRVMQKCGMTYVGTMRENEIRFGKYQNVGYYEILESDIKEQ